MSTAGPIAACSPGWSRPGTDCWSGVGGREAREASARDGRDGPCCTRRPSACPCPVCEWCPAARRHPGAGRDDKTGSRTRSARARRRGGGVVVHSGRVMDSLLAEPERGCERLGKMSRSLRRDCQWNGGRAARQAGPGRRRCNGQRCVARGTAVTIFGDERRRAQTARGFGRGPASPHVGDVKLLIGIRFEGRDQVPCLLAFVIIIFFSRKKAPGPACLPRHTCSPRWFATTGGAEEGDLTEEPGVLVDFREK